MGGRRELLAGIRRDERGFTLIELLTVLAMLVIVVTALATVLVSALNIEAEMNRRFTSQINARLALDQLRRELHCAASVTVGGGGTSVTVVLGNRCPSAAGGTTVSWCTIGSGSRFALYRQVGSSCTSSGKKAADYLTTDAVFTLVPPVSGSLAKLRVSLPVNAKPGAGRDYRLEDDIVLRNSSRA
ncbi:MAG TPA: type II secretion system protein [Gaiellaceae bacterium]|nr:type II secretion system protein [Gaiellaceae bacterium]